MVHWNSSLAGLLVCMHCRVSANAAVVVVGPGQLLQGLSVKAARLMHDHGGLSFPLYDHDLTGAMTMGQKALFLSRAGALLPRQEKHASACPCCKASGASDLKHLVLSCPAWGPHRAEMWAAILEVTCRREVSRVQAGDPGAVLEALLGADRWGGCLIGLSHGSRGGSRDPVYGIHGIPWSREVRAHGMCLVS
jgi:hypothetical protein